MPRPVWLSLLGITPQIERSHIRLVARVHAWVAGSVPGQGACGRQLIDVTLSHQCFSPSLSPSLSLSLELKK